MEGTFPEKVYTIYGDAFNKLTEQDIAIVNSLKYNSILYKKRVRNNDWKKRLNNHFKLLNNK